MGGAGSPVLWPVTTPRDPGRSTQAARECPKAVRQRAELSRGGARRSAARLAQPHRGGDVHLVHIEAGRPGVGHMHVICGQGVGVDRRARHQVPSLVAEAGCAPGAGNSRHPAGFDLLLVHGQRPGTVRGSMPGAQRQFGYGEGSCLPPPKKLRRLSRFRPFQDVTRRGSLHWSLHRRRLRWNRRPVTRFMTSG